MPRSPNAWPHCLSVVLGAFLAPLAIFGVAAMAPGVVQAQQADVGAISFGIGGGSSSPVGDSRQSYKTGFDGGAFVRFNFGKLPLSVRGDFTYQNFELRPAAIPPAGAPEGGTGTLLGGLGDLQFYLRGGNVRPYLLAGAGAWSVRTEYASDALPARTETRVGARAGAGVLLTFGSLELFAEGAVDQIARRSGAPAGSAIRVVPVTVGVIF